MTEYMERVSVISGKKPIIFVATHGADDTNTSLIAENLANMTKGYAVINRGWERADTVDQQKDKANCNNIEHCHMDVIKEEFLDPLIRFKDRILKKWSKVMIVYLHGMGNKVREQTGIEELNYVIGWGNGRPNSHTCQKWVKDFLIYHLATGDQCIVGEGRAGGKFSGWTKKNMVQLFRKWYPNDEIDSAQIEIIYESRRTKGHAEVTAQIMGLTFEKMLDSDAWTLPRNFKIPMV